MKLYITFVDHGPGDRVTVVDRGIKRVEWLKFVN
jgi:hypothetical protein